MTPTLWAQTQPVHSLAGHQAAVKALAWCPFQSNLLATGGGTADRCIKFWNTSTGAMLNSIDTGSQVGTPLCQRLHLDGYPPGLARGLRPIIAACHQHLWEQVVSIYTCSMTSADRCPVAC